MQKSRHLAVFLLVSLAACGDQPAPVAAAPTASAPSVPSAPARVAPVMPEPSQQELMRTVFGAQYRVASNDALTRFPTLRRPDQVRFYRVKPLASKVLDTGVAVLLAQSDYAQQNTEDDWEVIEDEALFNAYLLRRTAGNWEVFQRRENFMIRGENSGAGSILFPMLNDSKQGMAVVSKLANDGCPNQTLFLFDLSEQPMREITGGIATGWTNNSRCGDAEDAPEQSTSSTWHLAPPRTKGAAYHDVVLVSVTETVRHVGPGEDDLVTTKGKKVTTRYAYDGKQFKLIRAAR